MNILIFYELCLFEQMHATTAVHSQWAAGFLVATVRRPHEQLTTGHCLCDRPEQPTPATETCLGSAE
jgi:hypothetical protein